MAPRDFPSSKLCSACGEVLASLPLDVREWDCPVCGAHHDRDVNAAKNLAANGQVSGTEFYVPGNGGFGVRVG